MKSRLEKNLKSVFLFLANGVCCAQTDEEESTAAKRSITITFLTVITTPRKTRTTIVLSKSSIGIFFSSIATFEQT